MSNYIGTQPSVGGVVVQAPAPVQLTADFSTTSTSLVATGLIRTVSPTDASNSIDINAALFVKHTITNSIVHAEVYADGVTTGITGFVHVGSSTTTLSLSLVGRHSPATTASVSYEIYLKVNAGTGTLRGLVSAKSAIAVQEISPNKIMPWAALGGGGSSHGQCRLTKSGANLSLDPKDGNGLVINGTSETVVATTLVPTGLSATTLYYIYAYMSTGTLTLEASTTGHSTHTDGVEIKTGDATRTLVGMAYVKTAAAFADTNTQRFVLSHFNRKRIAGKKVVVTDRTTTSTTFVELNSADRVEFITWADEIVSVTAIGSIAASANGTTSYFGVGQDGGQGGLQRCTPYSTSLPTEPMNADYHELQAEGYHYSSIWGAISSGTYTARAYYCATRFIVQG